MYNLYVWAVGFILAVFAEPLANIMIKDELTMERIILMVGGLILMLLSPNQK